MQRVVMRVGYVIPFAIFGTVLLSAGSGLYSTLQPSSSTGKWVGFQIIAGAGSGSCLQMVRGSRDLSQSSPYCDFQAN